MLSNLASYLGYAAPSPKTLQVENAPAEMRLRDVEEDEWVLVERNGTENEAGTNKEVDEDSEMTRVTLATSTQPGALPGSTKTLSRSASLDILNPLQESWYLTPPPSFTSEGPVHMETSPLENLLIEHPSMSVYERSQRVDTANRKMTNSSPSSTAPSEEDHSVVLMPIKERMYKLPRNKLSKKQSARTQSPAAAAPAAESEKAAEPKEPKIKNFVKSPRRSLNSEVQNFPKKAARRRPESSSGNGLISKNVSKDVIREEPAPVVVVPSLPPRRLYSEVLASKVVPAVQTTPTQSPPPPTTTTTTATTTTPAPSAPVPAPAPQVNVEEEPKANLEPEPKTEIPSENEKSAVATPEETVMSIEEENSEEASDDRPDERDRRKVVQTLPDRQNRLHTLNRSAQKVEQRKTCDLMKKNPLIRTNKAREFNFRNKRQRRADMMQRHSGANNNRKCAKTSVC